MTKKEPKNCRFLPWRVEFSENQKRLGNSLTFTPERLNNKFQKIWLFRLGENALQTNERTDGRGLNHRSLRKNSVDQQLHTIQCKLRVQFESQIQYFPITRYSRFESFLNLDILGNHYFG